MKYTLNDIEDKSEGFKSYIKPGVHEVEIIDFINEVPENQNKTANFQLKMASLDGTKEFLYKNYLSEGAMKWNLVKAKHIATNSDMTEDDKAKIGGDTQEALLKSLLESLVGKKTRIMFGGEEYVSEGQIKERTTIGLPPFAEKLTVSKDQSDLKFDKSNKWHFKKLPQEIRDGIAPEANEDLGTLQF